VSRTDEYDYDEYSDFVVVAESEDDATTVYPGNTGDKNWDKTWNAEGGGWQYLGERSGWLSQEWPAPDKLQVELIGTADERFTERTIICASFHAG